MPENASFVVERYADVNAFAERATPWLLEAEAENNLLLSIVEHIRANRPGYSNPYFAVVSHNGAVAGCAFRTPPYKLGLTRMPSEAVTAVVNDVLEVYDHLPAVLGPAAPARIFAEAWALGTGRSVRQGMRSRIYSLSAVQPLQHPVPGALRHATRADLALVMSWLDAFSRETHSGAPSGRTFAENHISSRSFFLWEDEGEARASAVYAGRTPNGVRIGFVYTPPEFRGRGYASACVAEASRRALESGYRFCCLYADLDNPTSNSIYQRIGYQPVCDVSDYEIS